MIVTHFQKFFRWPGADKKEPKGQPDFIFCVSFFDLCPNVVQGGPRRCPRETKRGPGGAKGDPKGVQRRPRRSQKRSRGSPGGPKRGPGGAPGAHGGGKAAGNWIYIYPPHLVQR